MCVFLPGCLLYPDQMSYGTLVDHRGVQHRYRAADVTGTCLCGSPPVGIKGTDPPPNLDPAATYTAICEVCWQVAVNEAMSGAGVKARDRAVWDLPVSVTPRRAGKKPWFRGTGGTIQASRGDHVHPPDPLTAPWAALVEEG